MKFNWISVLKAVVAGLVVIAFAGGVFYVGYEAGVANREVVFTTVVNQEEGKPATVDFGVFWDAWKLIRQIAFKSDQVDDQALVYGAVRGLVGALDDPHSIYFTPEESRRFDEDISGEFGGIGIEIGEREDQLTVISPIKGTPADQAGLKAGDAILKINDTYTADLTIDDAVSLIRGPKGTAVKLLIMREGWEVPQEFSVTRGTITIPSLEFKMIGGAASSSNDIAYIHLFNFNENLESAFYEAAGELLKQRPKGLVLDLRNNPGGFLEVSVRIAAWFLDRGAIVTQQHSRIGDPEPFRAQGNGAFMHLPTVILVNEGSASAAEILAGALRDHRQIPLVGTKTFGKGSVQEVRYLDDGSSMKITTAQWLTPHGNLIDGIGLEPDHKVELTPEDAEAERDPQLDKALEVLKALGN